MMRRRATPALVLFGFLLVVLLCRTVAPPSLPAFFALLAAGVGIALLALAPPSVRYSGILLVCASLGAALGTTLALRMDREQEAAALAVSEEQVTAVDGRLGQDSLLLRDGNTLLRLRLRHVTAGRRDVVLTARADVSVIVRGDWRFSMGELVATRGKLRRIVEPGAGERYVMWIDRGDIEVRGFSSGLWAARARAREAAHRALSSVGWPASGLIEALLIGSREEVPVTLQQGFRRTGSLHVLALSGLHAGILFAAILGLLRPLGRATIPPLSGQALRFLVGTVALAFYQFIAGFSPSLVRATIMIVVGGVALLLDRDTEPLNVLAVAGTFILAIDPFQADNPSFQLSFLALGGILCIGPSLARPLEGRVPPGLLQPFAASIGAQFATLPVVLLVFGEYYPSGILASLALVPLVTAMLWGGLAWLAVFPLAAAAARGAAVAVFGALYAAIDSVTSLLARLPGVTASGGEATAAAIAAGVAALGIALATPLGRRGQDRRRAPA